MPLLDLTLIVSQIIALAVVLLPVEAGVMSLVYLIRKEITSPERRAALLEEAASHFLEPLTNPEQRKVLIHEVAAEVWKPLSTPEARQELLAELWLPLTSPEARQKLISEIGHGLMRAFTERAGSMKGALLRSQQSELLNAAVSSGDTEGLLSAIPGKFEIPGTKIKVTAAEGLQLMQGLRGLLGGLKNSGGGQGQVITSSIGSSGGYPP